MYLAVVIDLYSRAVVGWSMKNSLETKIVLDALTMAKWRRKPKGEIIIHSDQGSQFVSDEFNRWCTSVECTLTFFNSFKLSFSLGIEVTGSNVPFDCLE